jgi:hypothetical protein
LLDPRVRAGEVETLAQRGRLALEITAHEVFTAAAGRYSAWMGPIST